MSELKLNRIPTDGVDVRDLRLIYKTHAYRGWEEIPLVLEELKKILMEELK